MAEVLPQVSNWANFYRSVGINPPGGPTTRTVQSVPFPSFPSPPRISASDLARGQSPANSGRLMPSAGLPANFGSMTPQQIAQIGVGLGNNVDEQGRRVTVPNMPGPLHILVDGANPIQTAQRPRVAPIPRPPYRAVGEALSVTPAPMPRPSMPNSFNPLKGMARGAQEMANGLGKGVGKALRPMQTLQGRTQAIDGALQRLMNNPDRRVYNPDINAFVPRGSERSGSTSGPAQSIMSI